MSRERTPAPGPRFRHGYLVTTTDSHEPMGYLDVSVGPVELLGGELAELEVAELGRDPFDVEPVASGGRG